jgi:hypothetical protein
MAAATQITLPVSLGEALDKLTILEIKLNKITDPKRKVDVQKEYTVLYEHLKDHVTKFDYHYRILRQINQSLWDIQDKFHGKDTTKEEGAEYCREILLENDRRFRVKAKINTLANSSLREQKGYDLKKAVVYSHLGLGDMIWMNGAVRYYATAYDEVYVICKEKYKANAAAMYKDDPNIKLILVNDDADLQPWQIKHHWFEDQGYDVKSCGFFSLKGSVRIYDLPNCFYDDLDLPREIRTSYFYVPRTEEAKALAAIYAGHGPYIVVHQQSSVQKIRVAETLLAAGEERLILDLNQNHYPPDHKYHELAQHVVNAPVFNYTDLLEGAAELHMIESSIYCLASHLDLSKVAVKMCYEPFGGDAERLGVFKNGKVPSGLSLSIGNCSTAA